jgi:pimeloyl-ACP methyl ester carboxylesterase
VTWTWWCWGATGYTGRLVAGYLVGHAPGGVRIGLAGRSRERLAGIRARLGASSSSWPLLAADVTDPASLAVLARATRVVVTTAVLGNATVPVLSIGSAVPANSAADLRSACPAITIGQTVGAGHFIQLEVPDQLNAMIERFMMITDLSAGW